MAFERGRAARPDSPPVLRVPGFLDVVYRAGRLRLTTMRIQETWWIALGPWMVRFAEKIPSRSVSYPRVSCFRLSITGCVAGPRGVIPTSATSSPGYPAASTTPASAAVSPPDVWEDIVGPIGFLQQFENKLFETDETRSSSSASQPQPENSVGELKSTAAPTTPDCTR